MPHTDLNGAERLDRKGRVHFVHFEPEISCRQELSLSKKNRLTMNVKDNFSVRKFKLAFFCEKSEIFTHMIVPHLRIFVDFQFLANTKTSCCECSVSACGLEKHTFKISSVLVSRSTRVCSYVLGSMDVCEPIDRAMPVSHGANNTLRATRP